MFLGFDHGFERPALFETMVFAGDHGGGGVERYATWGEAEAGHALWVAKVFKARPILKLPETA